MSVTTVPYRSSRVAPARMRRPQCHKWRAAAGRPSSPCLRRPAPSWDSHWPELIAGGEASGTPELGLSAGGARPGSPDGRRATREHGLAATFERRACVDRMVRGAHGGSVSRAPSRGRCVRLSRAGSRAKEACRRPSAGGRRRPRRGGSRWLLRRSKRLISLRRVNILGVSRRLVLADVVMPSDSGRNECDIARIAGASCGRGWRQCPGRDGD